MIFQQLKHQLQSLDKLLSNLDNRQYVHKISHLGNASIGAHTRHIIELLACAIDGFTTGTVDYLNRNRNSTLEQDRLFAKQHIAQLECNIDKPDKILNLCVTELEQAVGTPVTTTYFREIVYNTEHTIHHLALIKVALIEMNLDFFDENFGKAYSTLKHQAALAAIN